MTRPALSIRNLSYSYGTFKALDGVDLTVEAGGFTALLGPNGAGKSTLFALLTRLLAPAQGAVEVLGVDMAANPSAALARMGVVFQMPTLDLDLTVLQNMRHFAALHGLGRAEARRRAETAMDVLAISDKANVKARTLNGGHRRRVEIARALMHDPALLLLDEPTVGLDAPTRRLLTQHVHDLCKDRGIAVLWATHLIDEVGPDDHAAILHRGRLAACGPVRDLSMSAGESGIGALFDRLTGEPSC